MQSRVYPVKQHVSVSKHSSYAISALCASAPIEALPSRDLTAPGSWQWGSHSLSRGAELGLFNASSAAPPWAGVP